MGTTYVRLGPAAGVITRNKGGARVLSKHCCIGLKRPSMYLCQGRLLSFPDLKGT